jgi:DNA-binding response OmpR family regulator
MEQGKILVTEDEESLRFVLQKALENEGYWVETAANGATARRRLDEVHFDVSLIDIKLPDADGLELLKEMTTSPSLLISTRCWCWSGARWKAAS